MITVTDLSLNYSGTPLFSHVDLQFLRGNCYGIIGANGAGKSTFLKILSGELEPTSGYVAIKQGARMSILKQDQFQYDEYTILDTVIMGNQHLYDVMKATGWRREAEIRRRIDEVLTLVGLDNKAYKMPHELSGGEQQRLTIARALLNAPRLLLADEPTGNLDPVTADGIMRLFHEIAESGCAVIMSTHNTALIEQFPARTILFSKGRIKEIDLERSLEADRSQDVR